MTVLSKPLLNLSRFVLFYILVERRRRDYINSQISRLSSLLPPEMYHDV